MSRVGFPRPFLSMLTVAAVTAGLACEPKGEPTPPEPQPTPEEPAVEDAGPTQPVVKGLEGLLASMDTSADPCQDFYQYACGTWMNEATRPPDKPRYSRSFDTVTEDNEVVMQEVFDAVTKQEGNKLGDFYAACMDTEAIEAAGRAPLDPILANIESIKNHDDLMRVTANLHATVFGRTSWLGGAASPPLWALGPTPDYVADPGKHMLGFRQSGLGLPSRGMYVPEEGKELSEEQRKMLAEYETHVGSMLVKAGEPPDQARAHAAAIVAFETAMAKNFLTPVQLRDDEANYHKKGYRFLKKKGKGLKWDIYFDELGLPKTKNLNVQSPEYLAGVSKLVRDADIDVLKSYLRWHTIHAMAPYMASHFDEKAFELQKLVTGVEEQPPRWKRCANEAMFAMRDLVGQEYVKRSFGGESKTVADQMIDAIFVAMEKALPQLTWMDEKTQKRAVEKIKAVARKIGHPDKWETYEDVTISREGYLTNAIAERSAHRRRENAKIDGPVDKDEWHMPASLVNAYYNPTTNEIAFPAGILQPTFFSADQPTVMNFGGIGAVIGHELTHGFDDSGAKYDGTGRLRRWWEKSAEDRFAERVACVQAQYDAYEPLEGFHVNGQLTAGENIADIGGVKEAFYAYKAWEAEDAGRKAPVAEGMTNDQVFMVAWAQNWCQIASEAETKRRLMVDPHSPGRYRAVGPLANLPAFWEAFSCEEGTPMHPANACEVW